jgi:O-antigen/teichoic acid export membrane protein
MYTTRYLGSDNYGILSFSIAFASIMIFLADIGIGSVIVRDIARDKSLTAKYFGNVVLIKIVLAVITLATTAAVGYVFNYQSQTMHVVYVITLSLILTSFSGITGSIISAFEEMEYLSLGSVIYNLTMLLCALLAISFSSDVLGFAYVYLISNIILIGYWAIVTLRKIPLPRWDIDLAFWKYMIKESVPFGLSSVFVRIYYYIDTLMISLMILNPNEIMGWYNAAYRLVLIWAFIPTIFLGALYPIMSRYYVSSKKDINFMFEKSFKYLMVVAIPLGVGTTILADRIILLIYGADFSQSTIALQILVWSEVLIFLNFVFGNLLNSINRQIVVTKQTMLAAALNISLNLVLIPRYSYVGAGVATVSTELFAFFFLLYFVSKGGYRLPKSMLMSFFKILCASLIMYLFLEIFCWIYLLPLILLASVIYFVVVYLLGILDKEDLYLMRQLLKGFHAHKENKDDA